MRVHLKNCVEHTAYGTPHALSRDTHAPRARDPREPRDIPHASASPAGSLSAHTLYDRGRRDDSQDTTRIIKRCVWVTTDVCAVWRELSARHATDTNVSNDHAPLVVFKKSHFCHIPVPNSIGQLPWEVLRCKSFLLVGPWRHMPLPGLRRNANPERTPRARRHRRAVVTGCSVITE